MTRTDPRKVRLDDCKAERFSVSSARALLLAGGVGRTVTFVTNRARSTWSCQDTVKSSIFCLYATQYEWHQVKCSPQGFLFNIVSHAQNLWLISALRDILYLTPYLKYFEVCNNNVLWNAMLMKFLPEWCPRFQWWFWQYCRNAR